MKSYLEINDVFRFCLMNLIKKIPLRYQSNETAYQGGKSETPCTPGVRLEYRWSTVGVRVEYQWSTSLAFSPLT
jgi:hypothetical protein